MHCFYHYSAIKLALTIHPLLHSIFKVDYNTGHSTHVLIYACQGSWFGHENNADSWCYLMVNTTVDRPFDFHNQNKEGHSIQIDTKRNSAITVMTS